MACSLLVNEVPNSSESVDIVSDLTESDQMELLAQNLEETYLDNKLHTRIPYASIVTGKIVVEASKHNSNSPSEESINKYLTFLLPFNCKVKTSNIPGCNKCLVDDSCQDTHCVFCTRGFCHRGPLCKNDYSHFVMCGNGINHCRDERLRVRNLNKRREHSRYSGYQINVGNKRIRSRGQTQSIRGSYNPMELWRSAVKVWKPIIIDRNKASPNCKCCEINNS